MLDKISSSMLYIAIVGCRNYTNYDYVRSKVDEIVLKYTNSDITIISGGCRGVDKLAERYAVEKEHKLIVFKPDWTVGKHAGILRNTTIVNKSDIVIAFPSELSRGTRDTIRKAKLSNKDCYVFEI